MASATIHTNYSLQRLAQAETKGVNENKTNLVVTLHIK